MNVSCLIKELEKLGIPSNYYSINGSLQPDIYVLNEIYGMWEFFYFDERGGKSNYKKFDNEEDACIYLYKKLVNEMKYSTNFESEMQINNKDRKTIDSRIEKNDGRFIVDSNGNAMKESVENLKNKLDEIIDSEMKQNSTVWDLAVIAEIEKKYTLGFPNDYVFYLQYYGNDYIKDNYLFNPQESLEKSLNQNSFELDSIFGLYDDENNLEKKILFYQDVIPSNLFPIADLPDGDLVCMNKENNQIYFWIHDEVEDTYLVAQSFSDFMMQFQFKQRERINLNDVELHLSNGLDDLLKKAAEKYRK